MVERLQMDEWTKISDNRIMKIIDDVVVVKPIDHEIIVPLECDICGFLLRDLSDVLIYKESECCGDCLYKWAEANRIKWADGWRPDEEAILSHINTLLKTPSYLVN